MVETQTVEDVMHPGRKITGFPYAPSGWTLAEANRVAEEEGLELTEDHWEVVRALQGYFAKAGPSSVHVRELRDALDEKFHGRGGTRHLYSLFPAGPIAQGCRVAGLVAPAGSTDRGFGSVR